MIGGLVISTKKIHARRKEVNESEVYIGDCTSFFKLATCCSGEKNGCMQFTVEKTMNVHGLIVYEPWINDFFLRRFHSLNVED
jgi:hypothetical protein